MVGEKLLQKHAIKICFFVLISIYMALSVSAQVTYSHDSQDIYIVDRGSTRFYKFNSSDGINFQKIEIGLVYSWKYLCINNEEQVAVTYGYLGTNGFRIYNFSEDNTYTYVDYTTPFEPKGCDFDWFGDLWLADSVNDKMYKFDHMTNFLTNISYDASTPFKPTVDSHNNIWYFSGAERFAKLDYQNNYSEINYSTCTAPKDLVMDKFENIWGVCYGDGTGNGEVLMFNASNQYSSTSFAINDRRTNAITSDLDGNIFVGTFDTPAELYKYDANNNYILSQEEQINSTVGYNVRSLTINPNNDIVGAGKNLFVLDVSNNYSTIYYHTLEGGTSDPNEVITFNYLSLVNFSLECTPSYYCSGYASCNISDFAPCNAVTDANNCSLTYTGDYTEFLPQACNYCSYDVEQIAEGVCIAYTDTKLVTYTDNNFATCCDVTGIEADCYFGNESIWQVNESCSFFAYNGGDISEATIDTIMNFLIVLSNLMVLFVVGFGFWLARKRN